MKREADWPPPPEDAEWDLPGPDTAVAPGERSHRQRPLIVEGTKNAWMYAFVWAGAALLPGGVGAETAWGILLTSLAMFFITCKWRWQE